MSGFARFILVNYKQDLLGKNTVDNIGTFVLKGNELGYRVPGTKVDINIHHYLQYQE